jgi:hypothetical protein
MGRSEEDLLADAVHALSAALQTPDRLETMRGTT